MGHDVERQVLWRNRLSLGLCLLGSLQMLGHLVDSQILKAIAASTAASPLPKVFSDVAGFETFASDFEISGFSNGEDFRLSISPELYQKLEGPYNRRNVYGAALSYAPRLPEALWQSVFCYAFFTPGVLSAEFGLPPDAEKFQVHIRTKTRGREDRWILESTCSQ